MKRRRYGLAISALSALGCGASTKTQMQPAVVLCRPVDEDLSNRLAPNLRNNSSTFREDRQRLRCGKDNLQDLGSR
jgi:hypothetical protein